MPSKRMGHFFFGGCHDVSAIYDCRRPFLLVGCEEGCGRLRALGATPGIKDGFRQSLQQHAGDESFEGPLRQFPSRCPGGVAEAGDFDIAVFVDEESSSGGARSVSSYAAARRMLRV